MPRARLEPAGQHSADPRMSRNLGPHGQVSQGIQELGRKRLDPSLPQQDEHAAWSKLRHLMLVPGSQHSRALSLRLLALPQGEYWRPVMKSLQQQEIDSVHMMRQPGS